MKKCILMDMADNVATVLQTVEHGDELSIVSKKLKAVGMVMACEDIPFAHKICISPVNKGEAVLKFGIVIGRASNSIAKGGYAHIHNIVSIEGTEKVRQGGINND